MLHLALIDHNTLIGASSTALRGSNSGAIDKNLSHTIADIITGIQ